MATDDVIDGAVRVIGTASGTPRVPGGQVLQTSQEKRIYSYKLENDTVVSAVWTAESIAGTPAEPAVLESQVDASGETQIALSGLTEGCRYLLRPLITGDSGQIYEPETPCIIRCDF